MIRNLTGYFILVFLFASFSIVLLSIGDTLKKTETPSYEGIMHGTWAPEFEKTLNETLPIEKPSRSLWGALEYVLFGQGRKGVIVGSDGWLFTDEEFSCLPHAIQNIQTNLMFIQSVQDVFKAKNIELIVAFLPAKARLYPEYLGSNTIPDCRRGLYDEAVNAIAGMGIPTQGMLNVMEDSPDKKNLFLKTDTHWTTEGARMAAVALSETMKEYKFPEKNFKTIISEDKKHDGDLLRYLPGVDENKIARDTLHLYKTSSEGTVDASADLFSQDIPPVTLVGTSYSANPLWNFHGFLQEFLNADVLNMADEGLGPFTVMEKYLQSKALEETAPAVVIWEIPERYMTTKPEFKKK